LGIFRKLITYYLIVITFFRHAFPGNGTIYLMENKVYTGYPVMVVPQVVSVVVVDAIQATSAGAVE
jgi:hypothetical protein